MGVCSQMLAEFARIKFTENLFIGFELLRTSRRANGNRDFLGRPAGLHTKPK
jgi:hypothetical protein